MNLTTMLPLTFLALLTVSLSYGAELSPTSQNRPFVVKIVGYDQDNVQYAAEYRVAPSDLTPKILSTVKRQSNTETDLSVPLLRELNGRRELRRQATKKFDLTLPRPVKWVNPSPDGKYLFVGFEDPSVDVMRNAVVLKAANFEMIKEFKLKGRSFLLDSEWSSDSLFLAVLETSERYSKSLRGLLYLLLSHPVPLDTLYVNFVNVRSGKVTKILIAKDVPYGTEIITRTDGDNKRGK